MAIESFGRMIVSRPKPIQQLGAPELVRLRLKLSRFAAVHDLLQISPTF
jgi:hypothetical protein